MERDAPVLKGNLKIAYSNSTENLDIHSCKYEKERERERWTTMLWTCGGDNKDGQWAAAACKSVTNCLWQKTAKDVAAFFNEELVPARQHTATNLGQ